MRGSLGARRAPTEREWSLFLRAERANVVTTAYARLGIAVLLVGITAVFGPGFAGAMFGSKVALINLGIAVLGVALVWRRRLRGWTPYALASLDTLFLLGVMTFFDRFGGTLPGEFRPAPIAVWGFFLVLALSTVRGKPELLAVQTALFAAGFAFASHEQVPLPVSEPALSSALGIVFGPGYNSLRATVIVLTGALLVVASLRARANLWDAIASARRAASLARYLAPAVAEIVVETEIAALRRGRQQHMAVFFADVRGFTSLAETLEPPEIASFLNRFRHWATRAIEAESGVIDKFIGDEVMGLFGLRAATPEDAGRAVMAGRRLLASIAAWNRERASVGLPPVSVGVGIHYGPVFVGALGGDRLEFTVLGDTVNVARRIEELTKTLGHDLLVSAEVVEGARSEGLEARSWLAMPPQPIRGHREPVAVFAFTGDGSVGLDA